MIYCTRGNKFFNGYCWNSANICPVATNKTCLLDKIIHNKEENSLTNKLEDLQEKLQQCTWMINI